MIEVKNLNLRLNDQKILKDINLEFKNAEFSAILGPNGAGKSSLLKCLSGSCQNYSGSIIFNSSNIKNINPLELAKKRSVLTQFSENNLDFTALEIVIMGRNPYQENVKKSQEIALNSLKKVGALDLKDKIFSNLSGGQKQKINLARVLAQISNNKKSYLFLDEPTSALDIKHKIELFSLIKTLVKTQELSVISILHDINLAKKFTDHIIFLKDGEIFKNGRTNKILNDENIKDVFEIDTYF